MKAVVIGGGVAGLAAAYELTKHGHEAALYEAGPILGGQVRTFEIGGGRIESFYHHLFRSDTEISAMIEELRLGDDLEWIDSKGAMNAEQRNYPFVGPIDLLRFDRVSFLTRMRLGLAALWLRRTSDWQRYEGMRASDWISSRVGREGYERVWGPLLRAKVWTVCRRHFDDLVLGQDLPALRLARRWPLRARAARLPERLVRSPRRRRLGGDCRAGAARSHRACRCSASVPRTVA